MTLRVMKMKMNLWFEDKETLGKAVVESVGMQKEWSIPFEGLLELECGRSLETLFLVKSRIAERAACPVDGKTYHPMMRDNPLGNRAPSGGHWNHGEPSSQNILWMARQTTPWSLHASPWRAIGSITVNVGDYQIGGNHSWQVQWMYLEESCRSQCHLEAGVGRLLAVLLVGHEGFMKIRIRISWKISWKNRKKKGRARWGSYCSKYCQAFEERSREQDSSSRIETNQEQEFVEIHVLDAHRVDVGSFLLEMTKSWPTAKILSVEERVATCLWCMKWVMLLKLGDLEESNDHFWCNVVESRCVTKYGVGGSLEIKRLLLKQSQWRRGCWIFMGD